MDYWTEGLWLLMMDIKSSAFIVLGSLCRPWAVHRADREIVDLFRYDNPNEGNVHVGFRPIPDWHHIAEIS